MHPHFADGAMVLQAGVGLTQMAAMPHRRRSAVAPSVAETMEAGFLPALDEDQANMLPPLDCACTYTLRTRLLTLDILGCPSLFGNILG